MDKEGDNNFLMLFCTYEDILSRFRRRISEVSYSQSSSKQRPDIRTDAKFLYGAPSGAELRAESGPERLANGPVSSGRILVYGTEQHLERSWGQNADQRGWLMGQLVQVGFW